jgi:hypothetical protein
MTATRHRDRSPRVSTGTSPLPLPVLPHEHDESPEGFVAPTKPMRLAAEDLALGRVDTDCHGATPASACDRELPALLKPPPHDTKRGRATGG